MLYISHITNIFFFLFALCLVPLVFIYLMGCVIRTHFIWTYVYKIMSIQICTAQTCFQFKQPRAADSRLTLQTQLIILRYGGVDCYRSIFFFASNVQLGLKETPIFFFYISLKVIRCMKWIRIQREVYRLTYNISIHK